jgi:hypothetical protein
MKRKQIPFEKLRPSATRTDRKLVLYLWREWRRKQRFRKPLIVSPAQNGVYKIILGDSRYQALKNAGWTGPVDCVVARNREEVAAARLLKDRT